MRYVITSGQSAVTVYGERKATAYIRKLIAKGASYSVERHTEWSAE